MTKIKKENARKAKNPLLKKSGKSKKEIVGKIKAQFPKNTVKSKKEIAEKIKPQLPKKTEKSKKDGITKSVKIAEESIEKCVEVKEENEIAENIKAQLPKKTGKSKKDGIKRSVKTAEESIEKCVEENDEIKENIENTEPIIKNGVAEPQEITKKRNLKPKLEQFQIQSKLVKEAISVLKKLNEQHSASKTTKPLLDDSEENPVYLQVQLHKIPSKLAKQMIKIKLPHSLLTETSEVCLITGDLDKKDVKAEIEPTVLHYKELLKNHNVKGITQVVPLRQLRTEYKTFESKRHLSAAYDVFLCDRKICGVLPKLLGKAFYKKRKFPIEINMDTKNLKEQVEKALSEIVFAISCHGTSCTSEVARLSMEDDEILENILASVETLTQKIPGKTKNIQGLYIKTARSEAIPIYMSYDVPEKLKNSKRHRERRVKEEELSTLPNRKVKVFKDGRVRVIRTDNSDSEDESKVKPAIETEEVLPKSPDVEIEKKNKSKKRKAAKEEHSAEEESKVNPPIETEEVLPKSPKVKIEKKNKSKKRKVVQKENSDEED